MLIIFIYIYKLIICKIQIINCKGADRNAWWGERPADTGPGMKVYPTMYQETCGYVPGTVCIHQRSALHFGINGDTKTQGGLRRWEGALSLQVLAFGVTHPLFNTLAQTPTV